MGKGIFKFSTTRRLKPLERVKELGDASVPYPFDVHASILITLSNAGGGRKLNSKSA